VKAAHRCNLQVRLANTSAASRVQFELRFACRRAVRATSQAATRSSFDVYQMASRYRRTMVIRRNSNAETTWKELSGTHSRIGEKQLASSTRMPTRRIYSTASSLCRSSFIFPNACSLSISALTNLKKINKVWILTHDHSAWIHFVVGELIEFGALIVRSTFRTSRWTVL